MIQSKFSIRLSTLQQIDGQRKPFFIGTQPFDYEQDTVNFENRFALNNLVLVRVVLLLKMMLNMKLMELL